MAIDGTAAAPAGTAVGCAAVAGAVVGFGPEVGAAVGVGCAAGEQATRNVVSTSARVVLSRDAVIDHTVAARM
jgi:hypothetical protein